MFSGPSAPGSSVASPKEIVVTEASASAFACSNGHGKAPVFSDVSVSNVGNRDYVAIEGLACQGVVQGFPGGRFDPLLPVTRAQIAKMMVLALRLQPRRTTTAFRDVPRSAWFDPYVATAVRAGFMRGTTDVMFAPNGLVTREQMATMVARALRLASEIVPVPIRFSDAAMIGSWARRDAMLVVSAGLMHVRAGGRFAPLRLVTREEAASIISLVSRGRDQ